MARRFKNLGDVRRYVAQIINRLESGDLDETSAKGRAYIANILKGIIQDSDLEQRVASLEKRLTDGKL